MEHANQTPKQIVNKLDQYIVGQSGAKRAVAVALRNRYRRSKVAESMRDEITPKNILMIGPTGVGKTEIARRLSKLVGAPFVKVEATKFTEVGYIGRDVESMVRDLVEVAVRLVKDEATKAVKPQADSLANERLVELLAPSKKKNQSYKNPLEMFFNQGGAAQQDVDDLEDADQQSLKEQRKRIASQLETGELEDTTVTVEVDEQNAGLMDMFQGSGMEQMGMNMQDMLGNMMPKRKKKRRLTVKEARKVLADDEAQKLVDMEEISQKAVEKTEQLGMIFIDEIDKVAGKQQNNSVDVSREGVQRDILPIVEGATVTTKYGPVQTDHILFVAAGAFHISRPSDLIPELQGRFPIRVELDNLTKDDFVGILKEPDNALLKQYAALLETEGIIVEFSDEAVVRLAELAEHVNRTTENIGARRLHTLLERLLEDLSFEATDVTLEKITITPSYVDDKLKDVAGNQDTSHFIL
ncbi:ATP-dependent protease ATPase subunit HslU [Geomicrobium sp. JCM 19039]|uniref:ATP-dependent protease ATPase subunit HslU n=1 Tax=Geomicrobium sp. JCM 19039 TaxID=1460636 RepID=UPI00045F2833|nr:ATP-dependent protease ATPase subunit HslU [Geomicrobium sp. JCM 19039]GAK10914.1 ATP-dependent hsl protease ATP-binding subunit HslU [Geomicrobium sp. JCM 19039]